MTTTTRTTQSDLPGAIRGGGAPMIDADRRSDGPGPDIIKADTLQGNSVANSAGEDLGKIEAIMLDVRSGRIAYAVLSFGGFLGMGKKLFALPWSALTFDATSERFILDVSKEKLEKADGFDKDHWPTMADHGWANKLHTYYDVTPYWDDDYATRDARRSADAALTTNRRI